MSTGSLLFCICALALSAVTAFMAYPLAALSPEKSALAASAVPAEDLGLMDLGEFGEISVEEMVSYYIDNPPEPEVGESTVRKIRFEGC